jgi:hypothetical protein
VSPWERRQRGGRYYTRSRRINGRIERQYVGTGPFAEFVAQMDALKRQRRKEQNRAMREERESLEALDRSLEELYEAARVLTQATLLAAGFHRHRGEWRKRRG